MYLRSVYIYNFTIKDFYFYTVMNIMVLYYEN